MPALSGSLEIFRIQELLGLLSAHSGQWLLRMQSEALSGYVGLRDGEVVCASADDSRQDLTRRLQVDDIPAVTVGGADSTARSACVQAHIVSALAALTQWQHGRFSAERTTELPDDFGMSFPLARLGPHITALLTRLPAAQDALGGPDTVLAGGSGQVPPPLRGLHGLIDGQRSVAALIDVGGHGTLGTLVDLADLLTAGCAVLVPEQFGQTQRDAVPSEVMPVAASADAVSETQEQPDLLSALIRGVRGV